MPHYPRLRISGCAYALLKYHIMDEIKVVELFAGVGGFRVGLEKASPKFKIVWSNQWEPSTKSQDASDIYVRHFGTNGHSNLDIATVPTSEIPDFDMLVGGFPCQDYSVARTLNQSAGLVGKKGILWWEIHRILAEKANKPGILLLENVDRLLKSPVSQRGRDFAIMLASLSDLGYAVEWRVINAAEYGMPQRRKRVFLLGYHKTTAIYQRLSQLAPQLFLGEKGLLSKAFPIQSLDLSAISSFGITGDLSEISTRFNKTTASKSPFLNSGFILNRVVYSAESCPNYGGPFATLGDILQLSSSVPNDYFITESSLERWRYFKSAKNEKRINKETGFEYAYSEGGMHFPDPINRPSRTIITAEGGASPSRFKHVIETPDGRFRRLTPVELERLNMFPDNHTAGVSDTKRAFLMGNALVVGIVEKIGKVLIENILTDGSSAPLQSPRPQIH